LVKSVGLLRIAATTAGLVPVPNGSKAVAAVVPLAAAVSAVVLIPGWNVSLRDQLKVPQAVSLNAPKTFASTPTDESPLLTRNV
jgi:hypothetical protein